MIAAPLIAALLASTASAAPHRDLYVDQVRGDVVGDGSRAHPFLTLAQAVRNLAPGDVLHIYGHKYNEPLTLSRSGTREAPITVIGDGRPKIEAPGDAVDIRGSYIVVKGLDAHATDWGSAVAVGKHIHHVTIDDNVLHDSGCGGVAAQYTDYLTVTHNTVYGNARRSPWQCSGISLYHPEAVDSAPGVHNLIRENVSFDNQNDVVDENISHSNGHTTDGNGIIIDDGDHTQAETNIPAYEGLTLVIGNVVYNNGGRGIHVFHTSNVVVANNVAYQNLKDPKLQGPAAELSASQSRRVTYLNNIAVARPGALAMMDGWDKAPTTWSHNVWQSSLAPLAAESPTRFDGTNTRRDPGFVQPSLAGDGDFRLAPKSPARAAGTAYRLGADGTVHLVPNTPVVAGLPDGAAPGIRPAQAKLTRRR